MTRTGAGDVVCNCKHPAGCAGLSLAVSPDKTRVSVLPPSPSVLSTWEFATCERLHPISRCGALDQRDLTGWVSAWSLRRHSQRWGGGFTSSASSSSSAFTLTGFPAVWSPKHSLICSPGVASQPTSYCALCCWTGLDLWHLFWWEVKGSFFFFQYAFFFRKVNRQRVRLKTAMTLFLALFVLQWSSS